MNVNVFYTPQLVAGLEHFVSFPFSWGISSSQLTFIWGVAQPPTSEINGLVWSRFSHEIRGFCCKFSLKPIHWMNVNVLYNRWILILLTMWINPQYPIKLTILNFAIEIHDHRQDTARLCGAVLPHDDSILEWCGVVSWVQQELQLEMMCLAIYILYI